MEGMSLRILFQSIKTGLIFSLICALNYSCSGSKNLSEYPADTSASVVEGALEVPSPTSAHILFDSSSYHFGTVKQGGIVYRELHFINDGSTDLDIQLISACECTQLEWPQLPVKPGAEGIIKVRYDSKEKSGPQIVDVEILANTTPEMSYTKFFIYVEP